MTIYFRSSIQNIDNRIPRIKKNALLNLINNQSDIDKIYLHVKDPYGAEYPYLISRREKVGLKHYEYVKVFIEYSNKSRKEM